MDAIVNYREYQRILDAELRLRKNSKHAVSFFSTIRSESATDIRLAVEQIHEVALNSTVQRSYVVAYGQDTRPEITVTLRSSNGRTVSRPLIFESDGAHANLMAEIVGHALLACYGPDFGEPDGAHPRTVDGYSYRDIMRAIRYHDCTENLYGDVPDNGSRDESVKRQYESDYFCELCLGKSTSYDQSGAKVLRLLQEMQDKTSPTGRLLYISDKFAASAITLADDYIGHSPMLSLDSPSASARDRDEMNRCDYRDGEGRHRASEMWAVDMLSIRNLIQYDDTGFITACLIMYTLMVHGRWYSWREKDYESEKMPKHHS